MAGGIKLAIVPDGEEVPPCPKGYERLPGAVVTFGKILPKCKARKQSGYEKKCCGGKVEFIARDFCDDRDTFVSRQICLDCGGLKR
jgi:hypothetical protein